MRTSTLIMLLAAPLALTACDSGQDMESMDEMGTDEMAMEGHEMSAMDADDGAKTASVIGTVTAIDAEAGTANVTHGPIAEIGMPGMTMDFALGDGLDPSALPIGEEVGLNLTQGQDMSLTLQGLAEGGS